MIWPVGVVSCLPLASMIDNQAGVTRKQAVFVTMVTISETASLPPALRVHTDADASVQGVTDATRNPMRMLSLVINGESIQAQKGNAP